VCNSGTTDQAKDGGKKSFEVPSAREKVKETRNPKPGVKKKTCKVKVDRVKKSYGVSHNAQDQAREMNKGVGAHICQSRSSQVYLMV
jgi:hypothetical protein